MCASSAALSCSACTAWPRREMLRGAETLNVRKAHPVDPLRQYEGVRNAIVPWQREGWALHLTSQNAERLSECAPHHYTSRARYKCLRGYQTLLCQTIYLQLAFALESIRTAIIAETAAKCTQSQQKHRCSNMKCRVSAERVVVALVARVCVCSVSRLQHACVECTRYARPHPIPILTFETRLWLPCTFRKQWCPESFSFRNSRVTPTGDTKLA